MAMLVFKMQIQIALLDFNLIFEPIKAYVSGKWKCEMTFTF